MISLRWKLGQGKARDSRYDGACSDIVDVFETEITLLQDTFFAAMQPSKN